MRPQRHGNRNPNLTPAEAFRTKDGFITVVLMNPEQWSRFCGVIGDEESKGLSVLGPVLAGFGVALGWFCVRPRP